MSLILELTTASASVRRAIRDLLLAGPRITVSDVEPLAPENGEKWYAPTSGHEKIRVAGAWEDVNSEIPIADVVGLANALASQVSFDPAIVGYTGGGPTYLDGVATVGLALGTLQAVTVSNAVHFYQLYAGTSAEASPTIIRPDDYDGTTNAKIWLLLNLRASAITATQALLSSFLSVGTAGSIPGQVAIADGSAAFSAAIATAGLTAARSVFLPDASGVLPPLTAYATAELAEAAEADGVGWWDATLKKARTKLPPQESVLRTELQGSPNIDRATVSGITSPTELNATLLQGSTLVNGRVQYNTLGDAGSSGGGATLNRLRWQGSLSGWLLERYVAGVLTGRFRSYSDVLSPWDATGWTAETGTGSPVVVGVPLAGAWVGQTCRVGDASPYAWYRWNGSEWDDAAGGGSAGYTTVIDARDFGAYPDTGLDMTAELQAALDSVNDTVGEEYGGIVQLADGEYLISAPLIIKGPYITLRGVSQRATWIELTDETSDGIRFEAIGIKIPIHTRLEKFSLRACRTGTVTGIGVNTSKIGDPTPDEFWFYGLSAEDVDVMGFDTCWLVTNHPAFQLRNCTFVGLSLGVDLVKADTFGIYHCSGSFAWDRDETAIPGNTSTVFRMKSAIGVSSGPNFAGVILGGEYGNCQHLLDMQTGYVELSGLNTETYSGDWTIRQASGTLRVNGCRFANNLSSSTDAVVMQTGAGAQLEFRYNKLETDACPVVYQGDDNYYSRWDTDTRVEWKSTAGALQYSAGASPLFESKNQNFWNSIYAPSDWNGRTLRKPRNGAVAEDLVHSWTNGGGVAQSSSLINDKIHKLLVLQSAELASAAGGGETTLLSMTIPAGTFGAGADEVTLRAFGRFAANGNSKRLRVVSAGLTSIFDSGTSGFNDKAWTLESRYFERSASELLCVTTMCIDGQAPIVQTSYLAIDVTLARSKEIWTTGSAAGDVTVWGAKLAFDR